MALSVGLGRIVNDPDAPIRTRKALGRLATPGLLVTDEGLTINTDGRIVLKLSVGLQQGAFGLAVRAKSEGGISAGTFGLTEDDQGISIQLAPNSRLKLSNEGLALDDPLGDITVTNITVSQNATIAGNLAVAGILDTTLINSDTIINTGVISSDSLNVTGNASVGGTLTVATISIVTLSVSGNASIAGLATVGNLAVTGSVGIGGSASVGGALAVSGAISGNSINVASANVSGNAVVTGTLNVAGALGAASANISGNLSVAGTLSAATFNPANINTGDVTATGTIRTPILIIGGGVQIRRAFAVFATLTFSGSHSGVLVHSAPFNLFGTGSELLVGSPVGGVAYGTGFGSWSFAMTGTGTAVCRAVIDNNGTPFSVTITFLVLSLSLV